MTGPAGTSRARTRYGAAALSGLLLAGTFPPVGASLLAWVAPVPWFVVLLRDRGEGHKGPAYVFGLAVFTAGLWWLSPLHVLFPLGLSAILALYPLLFAFLFRRIAALGPLRAAAALPFLWVGVDLLREHLASGFPWLLPGHALARWANLRQAADLGGVHLLTFCAVLAAAAAALALAGPDREGERAGPRARLGLGAAALALPLLLSGYGALRAGGYRSTPGPRVLLVQPSIPLSLKREALGGEALAPGDMRNRQLALSMEGLRLHPDTDLVLWGETMIPTVLRESPPGRPGPDPDTTRLLHSIVDPVGIVPGGPRRFLGGAVVRGRDGGLRNAVLLVGPRGVVEARSDKEQLTPFGEYIPFLSLLPEGAAVSVEEGIKAWLSPFIPRLTPGRAVPLRVTLGGGRRVGFGGLVCYEVIFPSIARSRVRDGADVLLNLSNFAWYGTGMKDQALDMARFRAVETRRPLVLATNDGPTAVVDGNGEVALRLADGERGALHAEVPLDGRGTLYMALGDLFAVLCAGVAGLLAMLGQLHLRRGSQGGAGGGPESGPGEGGKS